MSKSVDHNSQTFIDMRRARNRTTINVSSVTHYLHDGQRQWERKRQITQVLVKDPVFSRNGKEFMNRTERYTRALRMMRRLYELAEEHDWSREDVMVAIFGIGETLPVNLHNIAFEPVLLAQASDDVLQKYAGLVIHRGILGCYLQTELGHGTNVAALETTATYIPETKEFEIHSPTLTSSKWWVGALGKTATHGVVQAKLILPDGTDMGPHLFLIQLRALDNHTLLPGIITGDIGPKAFGGYGNVDNGFARFNHVRIPKSQMLSRFAQVTDDAKYVKPPHAKVSYGGMLYIRSGMVSGAGWNMAKGITIAIRYATVRRQGLKDADGLESQVINYPSLYIRLLPILARAYVFIELGKSMVRAFRTMSEHLAAGDASLLAELHATTSGLKVLSSTIAAQDLETARRSMGGHGYSIFSGVGQIFAEFVPAATYEGDNFVLDQQVVRAAIKSFSTLFNNKTGFVPEIANALPPSSAYLKRLIPTANIKPNEPPVLSETSWTNPSTLVALLEWRAALLVHEVAQTIETPDATIFQRVSKAATEAFVAANVGDMIVRLDTSVMGSKEKDVLTKLYLLYLLTTIESSLTDFLSFGLLRFPSRDGPATHSRDPTRGLRLIIASLCEDLLPNAIGLTDAFGFTDWDLDSALGIYDGGIYEALWARVQTEPLNCTEVPEGYQESIRPMLLRGQRLAGRDAKL
ncbi:acyl- oxidase [Moniliophthora roreri MCA 2997]|uniref:Acyl-coenzyme A oxidase n=2 Tax=Moniliophthora roreri TaxID=221103 RepID=V2X7V8_MONRO|nr:acyl- oxidase [Moniliophthora roreri MCA 2997]KAI3616109.1 acyl-oxidase [Moniliophthora roreri]